MFSSLKVATVRGIPIRLHITMLIVAALMLVRFGWLGIPASIILFGSVLLHELGHSVVAQRYGIRIASIDLHLLGGMALMTEQPRTPKQELWIAAAGPAVSFLLGFGLLFLAAAVGASFVVAAPRPIDLIAWAAGLNIAMGVFNLIPALPMDGGRIFRAALQTKLGRLRATRIAATVSRVFGGLFIAVGLFTGQFSLALIGGLLFLMVKGEERVAEAQARASEPQLYFTPQGPVIDMPRAPSPGGGETREVVIDPWGRRYVVVTRINK